MPTTQRQIIAYNPATVSSWGFIFCLQFVRKTAYNTPPKLPTTPPTVSLRDGKTAYNTAPKNCLQPAYNLPTIFLRMRVRGCAPVRVCVGVGAPVCVMRAPVVRVGACVAFVGQGFRRPSVLMPRIAQIPPVSAFRWCFLVGVFFVGFRGIFRHVSVLACVRGRSGGGFRAPSCLRCRSCRRCRRGFLPCVPFCGQNRLFLARSVLAWVFGLGKKKTPFLGRFRGRFRFCGFRVDAVGKKTIKKGGRKSRLLLCFYFNYFCRLAWYKCVKNFAPYRRRFAVSFNRQKIGFAVVNIF